MDCPNCGGKLSVVDSRPAAGNSTRRRMKCIDCDARFSSIERIIDNNAEKEVTAAPSIDLSKVFEKIAENSIMVNGFMSSVTGATYSNREVAVSDTIKELNRLYKEGENK